MLNEIEESYLSSLAEKENKYVLHVEWEIPLDMEDFISLFESAPWLKQYSTSILDRGYVVLSFDSESELRYTLASTKVAKSGVKNIRIFHGQTK